MQLPQQLVESLIGIKGYDKDAFEKIHASREQITSIRFNPTKPVLNSTSLFSPDSQLLTPNSQPLTPNSELPPSDSRLPPPDSRLPTPVPWSQYGYYLKERPSFTFDPLFHAGCYYVQEASSMFLEQAFKQLTDLTKPLKVLDLSAAPGGKSTHILSLISQESFLVCNDVIRSRANILKDNIIKWGYSNVMVTNNDPRDFTRIENYFDVIVVDAPCSGSGLFRREPEAMEEWSINNVQLCSKRQQRILADVWPSLKKDGLLIYSTCSYSKEEDEDILDWLSTHLPVANCPLSINESWGITETTTGRGSKAYRFWPDKVKGEGFFLACFRKMDGDEALSFKTKNKLVTPTKSEAAIVAKWADTATMQLIKKDNTVYAWPLPFVNDFSFLLNNLRIVYSGTIIGEIAREKLIPDHALAMSPLIHPSIAKTSLEYGQAIDYLKKKELKTEAATKGWQLVFYEGNSLGWINVLPNRINNYYPKELRILKDS